MRNAIRSGLSVVLVVVLGLGLLPGCGGTKTIYVYPDGGDAAVGFPPLSDAGGGQPDAAVPDSVADLGALDVSADLAGRDGPGPLDAAPADRPEPADVTRPPDVPAPPLDVPAAETAAPDVPPTRPDIPPATDDCGPLGLPERWAGTFEGDIVSNIPDMGGYTFQGPVHGAVRFEIRCVNQKFLVIGELDGGSTNCALASGCPFTGRMNGFYDPTTQRLQGQLLDAVIDFSLVQVYAEGTFDGVLSSGPVLSGGWDGEKTDISLPALAWVTATGGGTWEATPE